MPSLLERGHGGDSRGCCGGQYPAPTSCSSQSVVWQRGHATTLPLPTCLVPPCATGLMGCSLCPWSLHLAGLYSSFPALLGCPSLSEGPHSFPCAPSPVHACHSACCPVPALCLAWSCRGSGPGLIHPRTLGLAQTRLRC